MANSADLEPDHLTDFGLEDDPFLYTDTPLFEGGNRGEQFARLRQWAQFSEGVVAVTGDRGFGKSAFKTALRESLEPHDQVVQLEIPVLCSADQLLIDLARKLHVALPDLPLSDQGSPDRPRGPETVLLAALRQHGAVGPEREGLAVAMLADAHNLDDASLATLARLSWRQETGDGLHLVLFGRPALGERLRAVQRNGCPVQLIELDPLSQQELKQYLRFRLDTAGFDGVFPFRAEDITRLWEESRGVPGAVHAPARKLLQALASPPPEPKPLGLPIPHMVLLIGLVGVLLIALFYQSADRGGAASPPASTLEEPVDEALPAPAVATDVVEAPAVENDAAEPAAVKTHQDGAVTADDTQGLASDDPAPAVARVEPPAPESGTSDLETSLQQQLEMETRDQPLSDDESSLMALSASRYTLQLMAGGSRESLSAFAAVQPNRQQLRLYTARRNGQVMYILVAGSYADAEAARQAVARLPDQQRKAGPWPRTIASVQEDIRRFRDF